MSPLTRRESMLKALEHAGPRGVTRRELMSLGGSKWRHHLAAIEDAYYVRKCRSRFSSETWRWVLIGEQLPQPAGESCPLPPQLGLLTPSGQPAFKSVASDDPGTGRAPVASSILRRAA